MLKTISFDATDLKRAVQNAFAPIARNHHNRLDKKATFRNVEVLQGKGRKEGLLKVSFFVDGNFKMEFEVDVAEMMKNHESYISGIMRDLTATLEDAKEKRRLAKPIILLDQVAVKNDKRH